MRGERFTDLFKRRCNKRIFHILINSSVECGDGSIQIEDSVTFIYKNLCLACDNFRHCGVLCCRCREFFPCGVVVDVCAECKLIGESLLNGADSFVHAADFVIFQFHDIFLSARIADSPADFP